MIDEPLTAVRRELLLLEKGGILVSSKEGGRLYFKLNRTFPFFDELKRIIYGAIALGDALRERLQNFSSIEVAFIYGSVAKGEETAKSDIDLMVVGGISEKELHNVISKIEREIEREINYTLMTPQEFRTRIKSGDPFLERICREEKIYIKGKIENDH
ncbi:MAG: nucleotidyltransferase domain-containing protein [Caldiserica bacterium]|nr:nucleotidyltransferase domain-containing protein [Caldisericota bacterium]